MDNYTIRTYEKWHLGSCGQRTGYCFSGIDDFDLILPKFDTAIQNDSGKIGSMQELMINLQPLENRQYTSRYTYDSVLGGSCGHFYNLNSKNDIRILIISDSYGKAVIPFLTLGFKEINYFFDKDVTELTPEYIEAYNPDIVILMYWQGYLSEGSQAYNFIDF